MSVVLRLMRAGAKKRPFYRVVAADSRRQRDGRFLEILGHYDPMRSPAELVLEKDQVQKWITKGAQPSTQVASLLRRAGMTWGNPSKPKKKAAAATPAKPAKKRAAPRKASARNTARKLARKKAGTKPAAPQASKQAAAAK